MDSYFRKVESLNKPRVQIQYEVENNGKKETRELPFVIGVIGDFVGNTHEAHPPMTSRDFYTIDEKGIEGAFEYFKPSLNIQVDSVIDSDKENIPITLSFSCMKDFEPESIINQVHEFKKLKECRDSLVSLLSQSETDEDLKEGLSALIKDREFLRKMCEKIEKGEK